MPRRETGAESRRDRISPFTGGEREARASSTLKIELAEIAPGSDPRLKCMPPLLPLFLSLFPAPFPRVRLGFALTMKTTHPSMINAIGTTKLGGERPDYHRRIEWYTRIRRARELKAISFP